MDHDKWIEGAALTSWVTFQVTWYSHWAFLFLKLTASEEWVAEILLWVPSISFSLLETGSMGPKCWCLYQEKGILVPSVNVYLAELLLCNLVLKDSYAGPEMTSTHPTECQNQTCNKRNRLKTAKRQLDTAKRQEGSGGSVVKLKLYEV